jgi:hypothetical protein
MLLLTGLALAVAIPAAAPAATSESFAYATYKEERGRLIVLVDALPASFRDDSPYVPIPVAIGLQTYGATVTVSPETFTLVDQAGSSYPAASYREVAEDYDPLLFDVGLVAGRPITAQQFVLSRRLPASFYPSLGTAARIPEVHLDAYTWFRDVIYFPRPDAGLGGVLTLRLSGGGIEPPLEVRFRVPLPGVRIR